MTLYRLNVHETLDDAGASTTWSVGQAIEVAGELMVRLAHGAIVKRDGFHESRAAALRDAASQVDALANRLIKQSWRMEWEATANE